MQIGEGRAERTAAANAIHGNYKQPVVNDWLSGDWLKSINRFVLFLENTLKIAMKNCFVSG